MGKFRIVYGAIDHIPSGNVIVTDLTLNISEITTHVSPCTKQRDCILKAQYDKYGYDIHDITAEDYEDVYKVIENQEVTFYPDSDDEDLSYQMIITRAKPYYRNNIVYKDALILEMKTAEYGGD